MTTYGEKPQNPIVTAFMGIVAAVLLFLLILTLCSCGTSQKTKLCKKNYQYNEHYKPDPYLEKRRCP